jgi:ribosomal protein L28
MRKCKICGKSHQKSITYKKVRSKYNPVNKRRVKANLQNVKLETGEKVKACVRCIRTLSKPEKIKETKGI